MLTQQRRRPEYVRRRLVQLGHRPHQRDPVSVSVSDRLHHLPVLGLGRRQRGWNVVDRAARYACRAQPLDPLIGGASAEMVGQRRNEQISKLHAGRICGKPFVIHPGRLANCLCKCSELTVVAHRQHQMAVGCGKGLIGHNCTMGVAIAAGRVAGQEIAAGDVSQPAQLRVKERDIDMLTLARPLTMLQGSQNRHRRLQTGGDVNDCHPHFVRLAVGSPARWAGDAHNTALRLDDRVIAGERPIGAGLAIAGDGAVDQAGIVRAQAFIAQPHPLHPTRLEVFHHHIGLHSQPPEDRPAGLRLQIERQATLIAIGAQKICTLPAIGEGRTPVAGVIPPARLLDLDHFGAVIAQRHGGIRAGQDARKVENCDVGQGVKHRRCAAWPD